MATPIYRPKPAFDLLQVPLLGALLRWRWGRLVMQLLFFSLAILMIYDGFTGPQFAPENLATVISWVHYRGFVVFAFLLAGNLFCMGCPFTIPRTLAKRLSIRGSRWPKFLRNKWLAIALLFLFLYAYEWLDLWASPLLTAWVIVGYFVASFVLEALFSESPFCKYVCPLGTFNFASSTISPFQITVADADTCRSCVGKECINGATAHPGVAVKQQNQVITTDQISVLGCGTELFAPQIQSNLDCTLCLDCARACPHDNVALGWRAPMQELVSDGWPYRWDLSFMILVFTFAAVSNAFGMVPPIFALESWMSSRLGITSEGLILLIIFGTLNLLLPIGLGIGVAWLSRTLTGASKSLRYTLGRYSPAFMPLAFGIWLAHYGGFHFLSSAGTIIPVFQNFLLDNRIPWLGTPDWTLGPILPINWLDPLELLFVIGGLLASLYVLGERSRIGESADPPLAQLPWLVLLVGIALAAVWVFFLPMEMRGTAFIS